MKGLLLVHLGKREEGIEMVKRGMRNDLTSHIVWHVFGLIQKGEKNYEEALKSYTQALRFDKVRSPNIAVTPEC
jgi:N-alpha-acetyltransferase 15/16, NatA auxiliary subunit